MKRRGFLAGLLAFAAAPALPKVPVVAAVSELDALIAAARIRCTNRCTNQAVEDLVRANNQFKKFVADFDGDVQSLHFGETFYPTVTITPSDIGHTIDMPLMSIRSKPYYQQGRWT